MNQWLLTILGYDNRHIDRCALSPHDFIAIAANDLPIPQWYDLLRWWVDDTPEHVLHPSIQWTCTQRAREVTYLTDYLRR